MGLLLSQILTVKRKKLGVNQIAAILFIHSHGNPVWVSDVTNGIESNVNVTSQLITRLVSGGYVEPVMVGRQVKYQLTASGKSLAEEILNCQPT